MLVKHNNILDLKTNKQFIIKIPTEPSFKGKRSRSLRLWHWSTFVVILGSLITVLLAKTLFNAKDNVTLVQQNLQKSNITVSPDQAKSVAHEFSDLLWKWHTYIGYVLAALLAFRILFEFFQPKEQKIIPILKNSFKYLRMPGSDNKKAKHYILVRCLYIIFYLSLFVQACTGIFMAYSDDVESLKQLRHLAKEIHNVNMWVILSYIIIHIGGVLLSELQKKNKGIVSDMINGGE
jgi:Ni/Fe-hydrogenase 1 B-type cytochrome subunit